MNATRGVQRGVSMLLLVVILALGAMLALGVMRILPMYLDYFVIMSSLESVQEKAHSLNMSPIDLRSDIGKTFDINNVTSIQARDLKIRRVGNDNVVQVKYEVRRSLVGNLDVVAHFDETVVFAGP